MSEIATATPPAAAPVAVPAGASTDATKPVPVVDPGAGAAKPAAAGGIESVKKDPDPVNPDKPYIVKVDGKEIAMSKDEVIAAAQKATAAEKRLQEAAKLIKEAKLSKEQANALFLMLRDKNGAKAVLTSAKLGIPIYEIAEEILAEKIKLEMMDEKERELHDTKKKLADVEEERKKQADAESQRQFDALKKHYDDLHEKEILSALETSGLPKSRWTVQQMARYMHLGLQRGVELRAADVIDMVKNDYTKSWNEMIATLPGDKLLELMGDTKIKEVSEALIKRARPNDPGLPANNGGGGDGGEPEAKKVSKEEWRKRLDAKTGKI